MIMSNTETIDSKTKNTENVVYAPLMLESYFSVNNSFKIVEDISTLERTSGATQETWLLFSDKITWPGPAIKPVGGPSEIPPRYGIRGIPINKIKVNIVEAFNKASEVMHRINCGDAFVGSIDLYWPLTAPGLNPEPNYIFTLNCSTVIFVGAFTGNVHFS